MAEVNIDTIEAHEAGTLVEGTGYVYTICHSCGGYRGTIIDTIKSYPTRNVFVDGCVSQIKILIYHQFVKFEL